MFYRKSAAEEGKKSKEREGGKEEGTVVTTNKISSVFPHMQIQDLRSI